MGHWTTGEHVKCENRVRHPEMAHEDDRQRGSTHASSRKTAMPKTSRHQEMSFTGATMEDQLSNPQPLAGNPPLSAHLHSPWKAAHSSYHRKSPTAPSTRRREPQYSKASTGHKVTMRSYMDTCTLYASVSPPVQ